MYTDQELQALDAQGFFPGPTEEAAHFAQRASGVQRLGNEWVDKQLLRLYGFKPKGLEIEYSDQGMAPWHGAFTWVWEEEGVARYRVQLRERLRDKGVCCGGLYSLEEILAHEAVHAARVAFPDSWVEEHLAYATSTRWLPRFLGPLVRRPREVWGLLGAVLFSAIDGGAIASCGLLALLIRLARERVLLRRAEKKGGRALLLRLTGAEIAQLARKGTTLNDLPIDRNSLRWRLIRIRYLGYT